MLRHDRTTLFNSNRSQAVRLTKGVAFPDTVKEVAILRDGKRQVIVPADAVWNDFFDAPGVDLGSRARSARPEHNRREVECFAARLEILSFDAVAADHAADIRADQERNGRVIGGYDLLIAGHARSRGLVVVTGNPSEFTRVDGLRCEGWEAP